MTGRRPPDFTIRLAVSTDEPAVAECAKCAYEKYVPVIGKPPGPMLADYGESIDMRHLHVLELDGHIAGFVACYEKDGKWLLENVALSPEYQGRGLGTALVDFAEDAGRRAGHSVVALYTHQKMTENIGYYRSLGYREVEWRTEDGYERVYMEKRIA